MQTRANGDLERRIAEFDIDGGPAKLTFARRLALENGWSLAYGERVVVEYKRFVYLAMTAGHPVTPSEDIDEAWHLHLTYTESYWTRMCGEILPRPLHHNPTKGGEAEDAKFFDWYSRTLESYRAAFGAEPPRDIWPSPRDRFATTIERRKVNPRRYWIVPKLSLIHLTILIGFLAVGCGAIRMDEFLSSDGFLFGAILGVAGFLVLLAVLAYLMDRRRTRRRKAGGVEVSRGWFGGCGGGTGCATDGGNGGGGCGGGGCGGCGS